MTVTFCGWRWQATGKGPVVILVSWDPLMSKHWQMVIVCARGSLVHVTMCCSDTKGTSLSGKDAIHWSYWYTSLKIGKDSLRRNDGVLPPNWWRENANGLITGNMLYTPKRRQIKLELQSSQYMFCWQGKNKNHSPTKKENVSNIFKLQYFKRKLFFVLCIASNLKKDSFINSFSLSFKHLVALKKKS